MQIASFTIHYTPSEDDYYYDNDEVWAAYYDLYPDEDVDFETFIEDNPEFGTYTGESFPVGIITFDPSDGKRVTKLLDPYSIEAPEWYSDYIACDIEEIIDEFFKSDGPGLFDEEGGAAPHGISNSPSIVRSARQTSKRRSIASWTPSSLAR